MPQPQMKNGSRSLLAKRTGIQKQNILHLTLACLNLLLHYRREQKRQLFILIPKHQKEKLNEIKDFLQINQSTALIHRIAL